MTNADYCAYMEFIIRVIRADAYDNTVMETSIGDESIMYLTTLFTTSTMAVNNVAIVEVVNRVVRYMMDSSSMEVSMTVLSYVESPH